MTNFSETTQDHSNSAGAVRAAVGLVQGLVLYFLFENFQANSWPASNGPLFAALCATSIFVPLIVVSGLTHLRSRPLAAWTLIVALLCASLAYYDIIRDPVVSTSTSTSTSTSRNIPSAQFLLALSLGLFIAHSLLIAGTNDQRFIARYSTLFAISWKHGVQILLAGLFAAVFWLLLFLGAELFNLIKIDFLSQIIQKNWFWIPATTLVLNYAIHVTDIRAGVIGGVRTLSCNLLSWLLPLLTLIVIGFLTALPFTGLEPLWSTRHASRILLTTAASLIFLINAAYRDGGQPNQHSTDNTKSTSRILYLAQAGASAALVPLVLLAAYGIVLRIAQYGWTPERVVAAACLIVAACYAIGYVVAVLSRNSLWTLEATNVATAFTVLVVLLALFTPIADPARISVSDQIHRLNAGKISPDKFDYLFLRFHSGRYGVEALQKLAEQEATTVVAQKANEALQVKKRYDAPRASLHLTALERARNITVAQPVGETLPQSFLDFDWNSSRPNYLPPCLTNRTSKCDAILTDVDGDGSPEVILLQAPAGRTALFKQTSAQSWAYFGDITGIHCRGARDALLAGNFELAPPSFKDLNVNGHRLRIGTICSTDEGQK